ncbi:MAG: DUF4136 domain-containing protein [Thermoanaerobaculia bacterium]
MKTKQLPIVFLFFLALPALGQKVYVDYDGATAFSQYRTFQLYETREDLRDFSLTSHKKVVQQLRAYAEDGGLQEVDADPDVYVAYYTADRGDLRLVLSDLEYTYGSDFSLGSYWEGGVGNRTSNSFTFKEGTLIIDVWDANEKRLVWRGMATAAVSKNPDKNDKKIERAIKKMTKNWENMYGGHVRALRKYQEGEQE